MKRIFPLLLLLCLTSGCHAQEKMAPEGAWIQDGIVWSSPPADVNPTLQYAQTAILYFAPDHTFALLYATVNRVPSKYEVVSNGDGQIVYLGTWQGRPDGGIAAEYRLVSRSVQKPGESLPGSAENRRATRSGAFIVFDGRKFQRDSALDASVRDVISAAKIGSSAQSAPTTK